MNRAMVHRGPDDEGIYLDRASGVGLGARRLSIIDVAGGHQPLSNEDGTIWAVMNGEIYNFPQLRCQLQRAGHDFATRTDTEVLVHLYEDRGTALVDALEGMYSLAIWDSRNRRLLLARDRFGEKPLFYAERRGRLTFASELTALSAGLDEEAEVDPVAVDDYFVWGYVPSPASILRGVFQLPPGHLLTWKQETRRINVERYWRPEAINARTSATREGLVAEARGLLEASIASRLVADVPVGIFLSGGIDSSLVAAVAARDLEGETRTFTVGYDTGSVSEMGEARSMARLIGTKHRDVVLSEQDIARRVPHVLGSLDQPNADQALVALHAVSELARSEVKVAVGGEGADELFGGYPRYRWLRHGESMERAAPVAVRSAVGKAAGLLPPQRQVARLRDLLQPGSLLERHMRWVTGRRSEQRPLLYGTRLRQLSDRDPFEGHFIEAEANVDGEPAERRLMRLDQRHWLPDGVLQKADRATMLTSLEMRTPYLSRELAEFTATVPAELQTQRKGKALLREVFGQVLPEAQRRMPKVAFRVPAAEWLRGALAPVFERQLENGALYRNGWFERQAVGALFAAHRRGKRDATEILWPLLALGLWMDNLL